MAQVQSLALELSHATSIAKKEKKIIPSEIN